MIGSRQFVAPTKGANGEARLVPVAGRDPLARPLAAEGEWVVVDFAMSRRLRAGDAVIADPPKPVEAPEEPQASDVPSDSPEDSAPVEAPEEPRAKRRKDT